MSNMTSCKVINEMQQITWYTVKCIHVIASRNKPIALLLLKKVIGCVKTMIHSLLRLLYNNDIEHVFRKNQAYS